MNGKQDDGIIRIERSITGVKSDKDVTVEFSFYGSSQIFNTLAAVVGYIGSIPTTSEQDFTVLGSANEVEVEIVQYEPKDR
jgi:hypothetical protein